MENYEKGQCVVEDPVYDPLDMPSNTTHMKVKAYSKVKNLLQYAITAFSEDGHIVWEGFGDAIPRVIACAECMKRELNEYEIFQAVRMGKCLKIQTWKPKISGLDDLKVTMEYPALRIFLSKTPISDEPQFKQTWFSSFESFKGNKANKGKPKQIEVKGIFVRQKKSHNGKRDKER